MLDFRWSEKSIKVFTKQKIVNLLIMLCLVLAGVAFNLTTPWQDKASARLCVVCHSMKPEYYTWMASSHNKIACTACHAPKVGEPRYLQNKVNWLKKVGLTLTDKYPAPIRQVKKIPDSFCEQCHQMNKRVVSPSGDLIIPHSVHKKKEITCTECHDGIVHGKIPDRQITYKSDYEKWNLTLARTIMDAKYTAPSMDDCLNCHKLRNGPLACDACHTTGMKPPGHQEKNFMAIHGQMAIKDLKYCESCHGLMSEKKVDGFETPDAFVQFLNPKVAERKVAVEFYAKANTFCRGCHAKRPPNHTGNFIASHGSDAAKDYKRCLVCHYSTMGGKDAPTAVVCSACHPSMHSNTNWKKGHPYPLPPKPEIVDDICYKCHNRKKCVSCHR